MLNDLLQNIDAITKEVASKLYARRKNLLSFQLFNRIEMLNHVN